MQKLSIKLLIFGIIAITAALWLGFTFGRTTITAPRQIADSITQEQDTSLFDSQSATVLGKVTKINSASVVIERGDGKTGEFPVAETFNISRINRGQRVATAAGDTQFIVANEEALISFTYLDGSYKVTAISYLTPSPTKAPVQSQQPAPTSTP